MEKKFNNYKYILLNIKKENEKIILKIDYNEYYVNYEKEENILKIERVAVLFEFRRLKVGSTLIKNIIQYFIKIKKIDI